jgi:lysozyme
MAFNLGVDGLLKFKNTLALLRSAIESHASYARVADGMLNSLWAKQVGRRADELARQMRTGEYA